MTCCAAATGWSAERQPNAGCVQENAHWLASLKRPPSGDSADVEPRLLKTSPAHLDGMHILRVLSSDLAAPEGRVVGREVAVRDPEVPLQFDGVARRQRHHGLQPDGGCERDVGGRDFAEGATDFRGSVQHQPPTHAGRGAGVDLVEQRCAEEVGTVDGRHEAVVRHVEGPLVIVVGVVQADLRPGPDAHIVVVVGVGLEAGQLRLVDDAIGVVDAQTVEEGAAIGRDRDPETVRCEQATSAFVTKLVCKVRPRSSPAASLFMV